MDRTALARELTRLAKQVAAGNSQAEAGILEVHKALREAEQKLDMITWTDQEVADATVGEDMNALRHLVDSAVGRSSTLIQHLRRISR